MNLDRYEYAREWAYKEYSFYSEGPNGRILKVVSFVLMSSRPVRIYNLALGDWNNEYGEPDYWSVTNNGDTEKVFATVAAIILDFTSTAGSVLIQLEGNSPARKRLYQMTINRYRNEIAKIFQVLGRVNYQLEAFQKNTAYDLILIARMEYVILREDTEIYMPPSTKKKDIKRRVYNDRVVYGPPLVPHNHPALASMTEAARKSLERCTNLEETLIKYNLI